MTEAKGLSPENFALYQSVWKDASQFPRKGYWAALNTLIDAARAEEREKVEGWKLVPIEPNGDMRMAAWDAYSATDHVKIGTTAMGVKIYRAMLAAAPAPADGVADV
jgi:hypothetical protein